MCEEKGSKRVKDWLEATVKLLVDHPDEVRIEEVLAPDGGTSYFSIYCKFDDKGQVVGRGGANIIAVRKIILAIGLAQYKRRCDVSIYEPRDGSRNSRGR